MSKAEFLTRRHGGTEGEQVRLEVPRRFQFRLRSLLLLMVLLAILLGVGKWSYDTYVARLPVQLPWKPYSRSEMGKLRTGSRPVLIHFMAQWDLNGIYVLRSSLETREVAAELERRRFELRLADWTEPDANIEQALNEYQSNSIPLIVIHPAGSFDEPIVLRDLVSKEQLMEAIGRATSSPKRE